MTREANIPMPQMEAIDIPVNHGILEGLLRLPDMENVPTRVAVVCHPHPLGQGTMHNKVVFTIAKALNAADIPALRFNFRGVGRSTGRYDEGRGEADDVRAAIDWMATRYPTVPLLVAGFSFGAWVGLRVASTDPRVTHLIGAGIPIGLLDVSAVLDCTKPKLIVQSKIDEYAPLPALESWYDQLTEPKTLALIDAPDHFFSGKLEEVASAVTLWARQNH